MTATCTKAQSMMNELVVFYLIRPEFGACSKALAKMTSCCQHHHLRELQRRFWTSEHPALPLLGRPWRSMVGVYTYSQLTARVYLDKIGTSSYWKRLKEWQQYAGPSSTVAIAVLQASALLVAPFWLERSWRSAASNTAFPFSRTSACTRTLSAVQIYDIYIVCV